MKKDVRLPAHIKPERYKIILKPDLENFTFAGEETIFLDLEKTTKQITLHSAELEIDSVEWVLEGQENWAGKITYDAKTETAAFSFPKNLTPGKGKLKLIFRGILNDKMRGFYRSKYTHNGEVKHLAVTQFESTDARRAFPCFDEPSHKTIFDVTLMVPSHTAAISNTVEENILEHESGYKLIEFAPTPKMSTYLLAFIVGEFEYIEGKRVRVFTTPGKKEQARFALDVAIRCLDFYENYFGIDYPLPVLDMIAIPDFAAGAMENWGAVTYRESTLLIDEQESSTANKQWVALVIAHELAHMWFGNLVTMEWWTHLWLNEGFASFIEYLAIDHIFPDWEIWTQFVATEMGVALSLDSLQNTHPIEVSVGHPAEISEIFDKVSYSKGAAVLRMLHEYLGEEDFKKGLQHYLKKYAYGNATTEDLWRSFEEVSKKEVRKVMKNWTFRPGHPVITVVGQAKKLKLSQSRFFLSPISARKNLFISKNMSKDQEIWSIPIDGVLMNKKTMTIPKSMEKLNKGEVSFVRVDYPKHYLSKLKPASPADRIGLIRDAFDLAQAGNSPTILALELVLNYIQEEDYTVWTELTGHLSQMDSLLAYEPYYETWQNYGRQIYESIAKKIGWQSKNGEKHTQGLLRGIVLERLGSFGDMETIKKAQSLFGGKLNPDLKSVVYNLVSGNGGQKEFDALINMYKSDDNQQEKERIGRSLGKFKNKTLLNKTLNFAISQDVRYQNSLGIIASVWGNPDGRYLAWEFVKKNFKLLKDRYAGGHIFSRVFGPAGEFTKKDDAKDIESFVKKNPCPEVQRTIAQVLEQIYSNEAWLKRDRKAIRKFLEKFEANRD